MKKSLATLAFIALTLAAQAARAGESIWIEAEDLRPLKGYYFPANLASKTEGGWGLSGPGVAAEWNQGGESGFLSIAASPSDDKAAASIDVEVPGAGKYCVWVRYGDWREKTEPFSITLAQSVKGAPAPFKFTTDVKVVPDVLPFKFVPKHRD